MSRANGSPLFRMLKAATPGSTAEPQTLAEKHAVIPYDLSQLALLGTLLEWLWSCQLESTFPRPLTEHMLPEAESKRPGLRY
jgi:hypothetical protein